MWPWALPTALAVGVTVWLIQVHSILGALACALGGAVVGFTCGQFQWWLWRKRHPELTPAERMNDIRDAAPWN
jgi:hypothetical protein